MKVTISQEIKQLFQMKHSKIGDVTYMSIGDNALWLWKKKILLWHKVLRFRTNKKGSVMGRFNAPESIIHNPTVDADRRGAS